MFEVLIYVYENYWRGDACPDLDQLERKLSTVGFEADEIEAALIWLNGLNLAAKGSQLPLNLSEAPHTSPLAQQSANSMRVYSVAEQDQLGSECLGFISFLESSGVLPCVMREIVMDRAMAANDAPMSLDEIKIIILMVYWSFGEEPEALVLDELCDASSDRLAH